MLALRPPSSAQALTILGVRLVGIPQPAAVPPSRSNGAKKLLDDRAITRAEFEALKQKALA